MIDVHGPNGNLLFSVDAEDAREMIRSGTARRKVATVDGERRETLELTAHSELPRWVGGTKYHFVEEVAPGVRVHALKPSGCRLEGPVPIVLEERPSAIRRRGETLEILRAA